MPQWCTRQVFRCFKWLERAGDRLTGAAGPVFVTLAIVLLSLGVFCFFEVIQPSLAWPWVTTPVCLLIALNLFAHYYYVCTISPGFVNEPPRAAGTGLLWARRRREAAGGPPLTGVRWSEDMHVTRAETSKCRKCGEMRPERSHHCRICGRCVLKYDHHCPVRINQCVGIYNERHFVLFMVYLVVACFFYAALGWRHIMFALGWFNDPWLYYAPPMMFMMIYILAVVLCLAVSAMAGWHLYMVASGETSVETQDHEQYRKIAGQRGETFINSYDLGWRKNLELFFNVGPSGYPLYTLLVPLRIEPYTDGRAWARRAGFEQHLGVRPGEELTDEEEE
ncbi:zf-DHHC-domain-containing protein [Trametes versicolor FP-101664 SS1]|uniref:zf-DHHC-domain-containing protein n=1 Tax=Trametes versicolor (strain FP-101664) TaxID=717944 RepID=UPI0004621EC4|nr:zf-DHHC-domain-containing protein [Trametes versicolor FP-101664 SS1]EIW57164.1 zf-DHHC-domain-containing protein [Trametes versicolor FP-101664 SS1]